jgi:hypothetical protein
MLAAQHLTNREESSPQRQRVFSYDSLIAGTSALDQFEILEQNSCFDSGERLGSIVGSFLASLVVILFLFSVLFASLFLSGTY